MSGINRTLSSLISKGIDLHTSKKIVDSGYNLSTLSSCSPEIQKSLGIDDILKNKIFNSKRPNIPDEIVNSLLYKSKRVCCICRDSSRSVIIHHIIEWSVSKSNEEENLVVLCLLHHDEAHTTKELSQNLTPEKIKEAKVKWEKEVRENDNTILNNSFKELEVVTKQYSNLKKKWFNFLFNLKMNIELVTDSKDKYKFDFKINGKSTFLAKVYDIDNIDDLINKDKLQQNLKGTNFLDGLIVLASKPFLSKEGFYSNETNIQIGWIYNYGGSRWDSVMLKENYDISNGKFFVENLLYNQTNYKNFLTDDNFDEVMAIWNKKIE